MSATRLWSMLTAFVWMALVPSGVHAQEPMPDVVLVVVADCAESPIDEALFVERLRVELTSDGVREIRSCAEGDPALVADRPTLAIVRITSTPCTAHGASFRVRIDDFVTRKRVERTLDLEEAPLESRLRALAIATGELLQASWAELAIAEPGPDASESTLDGVAMRVRARGLRPAWSLSPPTASAPSRELPPRSDSGPSITQMHSTSIAAALSVCAFPSAGIAPLGVRVSIDLVPFDAVVMRFDAEVGVATSLDSPLGTIGVGLATGAVTLAYSTPVGEVILLSIGPRVSAGGAWTRGTPRDAATLAGSGAGPVVLVGAALEFDVRLADPVSARFGVDVSATPLAFEARVGTVPATGVTGAAIGVWAGLAIAP